MSGFLLRLALLTAATMALYYWAADIIPARWYFRDFWWLPFFIAMVTLVMHTGLLKRQHDGKSFIRYYMGSTGVKLFIYLTTIIVVAFINKPMAVPFALCFFFFYSCFTVFEVASAMKHFGRKPFPASDKQ